MECRLLNCQVKVWPLLTFENHYLVINISNLPQRVEVRKLQQNCVQPMHDLASCACFLRQPQTCRAAAAVLWPATSGVFPGVPLIESTPYPLYRAGREGYCSDQRMEGLGQKWNIVGGTEGSDQRPVLQVKPTGFFSLLEKITDKSILQLKSIYSFFLK